MSGTSSRPKSTRRRRSPAELAAENDAIYSGLNILAEYQFLGATFNGDDFKANGYIECYGFARADGSVDSNPSARVRDNGMYADSGEGSREVHIWDVAAKLGKFSNWQEAKKFYANKAGVVLGGDGSQRKKPGTRSRSSGLREEGNSRGISVATKKKSTSRKPSENPADVLAFEPWTDGRRRIVEIWIAKYKPGLSVAAIEANGGLVGTYHGFIRVLALPIYGQPLDADNQPLTFDTPQALAAAMLAAGPQSYSIWSLNPHPTNGTPLKAKNKETNEETILKMKTVGLADGVYGRRSLELIAAGQHVTSAWKVEGPTDLLSIDAAAIAEGLAGEVVVLSTAGGATQFNPWMIDLFAGLPTNIIGDDDTAGQRGADKAASLLYSSNKLPSVVRCFLGGEIKPDHGADVRDYFNETEGNGNIHRHTYSDFAGLAAFGSRWSEDLEAGYRSELKPTSPQATNGEQNADEHDGEQSNGDDNSTTADDLKPIEAGDDPHRLARVYLESYATQNGICTLRRWREEWHKWSGREYRQIGEAEIKDSLNFAVKEEFDRLNLIAQDVFNNREITDKNEDEAPPVARKVTRLLVNDVNAAMCGLCPLPADSDAPFWIDGDGPFPASEIFATGSGLIHLKTLFSGGENYQIPVTANFFSPTAVDYRFPDDDMTKCKPPERWYAFLRSLWGDDFQMIQLLQEWMGYCLLPDTSQQKIMLLIGPPRSGKGTISRVLTELVGELNVVNPRLSSFGTEFGIEPLIGKTLGIVSDARLSGRSDLAQIVETLLSISGEDKQTVRRMYKSSINTRLRLRFMIVSNELPALQDASGAFLNRCMLLQTTKSFLGNEDRLLEEALRDELPGIMVWAAQGWYRLRERGSFVQPESSRELLNELYALTSPIKAFVDECCEVGSGIFCKVDKVYSAYRQWCERQGRRASTKQVFGRDLRASMPHITTEQLYESEHSRPRAFFGLKLFPEFNSEVT